MKATWNNTVIAESDDTVLVEGNHYFPEHTLEREYITFSNHKTTCPWRVETQLDAGGKDFLVSLNPASLQTVTAYVEPSLAQATADDKFQFERHGYFVADRKDHAKGKPVFNRVTGLKDSWGK